LLERKLAWLESNGYGKGCFFAALEQEYDDRPGVIRDRLVESQKAWHDAIVKAVSLAIREHHFVATLDAEQLAFELEGIDAAYRHHEKLLGDRTAKERAMRAYDRLVRDFSSSSKR
jgi:hypothetical protein